MKIFLILIITIFIFSCSLIKEENISKIDYKNNLSKKEIEKDLKKEILE